MAYSTDLVVTVTQYMHNGKPVSYKGVNHTATCVTTEVMRVTFKGKNMNSTLDEIYEYRCSAEFAADISIAMSEFGINSNDTEYYFKNVWTEKTKSKKR